MSDVTIYCKDKHEHYATMFAAGARAAGGHVNIRRHGNYRPDGAALVFTWIKEKHSGTTMDTTVIREQRSRNLPVIVVERGFIGKRDGVVCEEFMVGLNGLNGMAYYGGHGKPLRRPEWEGLLQPWKTGLEGHVLVCGQILDDSSVQNHAMWLEQMCHCLCVLACRHPNIYKRSLMYFRGHPLIVKRKNEFTYPELPIPTQDHTIPFHDALKAASVVVTQSSNCGVEAALAGVPVIAMSPVSMAWDVSRHNPRQFKELYRGDRMPWLSWLSWAQWSKAEIESGEGWHHVKTLL